MAAEGSTAQREASPAAFAQTKRATQQSGLLPAKDQRTYPSLTPNNTGDQTTNQGPVELSETAIWLENSAVGHDVQESPPYEFSVASLVNILFPLESSCVSNASVNASDLHRILPSRALALRLLDHFVDKVLWIDHLLHTPTLHEHLADSFKDRNYGELPNLGQLSLLCTVLGLSAYFHTSDLGMSEDEATRLSQHLLDLAQRALVAANFTRQPTLESMQSSLLILYYLLPNTRGAVDYPSLIAAMTSWARKLNMHRIDSRKEQARREREGCDHVEVELKRRMWWFLTGSDWILSEMNGPFCGTYSIHPDHMQVNLPSNADDSSIDRDGVYGRPSSVPTEMSFTISRIQLSRLCRDITDTCAKAGVVKADLDYEAVLALDARFQVIQAEVPFFFRLDAESLQRADLIRRERPYMGWQGQLAQIGLTSRLSQLHLPFLARGYEDPRYASSREICLKSARTVISVTQNMQHASRVCNPKLLRMWPVLHHLFVSIVVLAMEYGFNGKDPKTKEEIVQACVILEQSQGESMLARRGIKQLKTVLDGWKAKTDKSGGDLGALNSLGQSNVNDPLVATGSTSSNEDRVELSDNQEVEPDFSWFDFDTDLRLLEWEELFKNLDVPARND